MILTSLHHSPPLIVLFVSAQMSKESTLGDAIDYILELHARKEQLQRELQEFSAEELQQIKSNKRPQDSSKNPNCEVIHVVDLVTSIFRNPRQNFPAGRSGGERHSKEQAPRQHRLQREKWHPGEDSGSHEPRRFGDQRLQLLLSR